MISRYKSRDVALVRGAMFGDDILLVFEMCGPVAWKDKERKGRQAGWKVRTGEARAPKSRYKQGACRAMVQKITQCIKKYVCLHAISVV